MDNSSFTNTYHYVGICGNYKLYEQLRIIEDVRFASFFYLPFDIDIINSIYLNVYDFNNTCAFIFV